MSHRRLRAWATSKLIVPLAHVRYAIGADETQITTSRKKPSVAYPPHAILGYRNVNGPGVLPRPNGIRWHTRRSCGRWQAIPVPNSADRAVMAAQNIRSPLRLGFAGAAGRVGRLRLVAARSLPAASLGGFAFPRGLAARELRVSPCCVRPLEDRGALTWGARVGTEEGSACPLAWGAAGGGTLGEAAPFDSSGATASLGVSLLAFIRH